MIKLLLANIKENRKNCKKSISYFIFAPKNRYHEPH